MKPQEKKTRLYDIMYTHYTHMEIEASSPREAKRLLLEEMTNDPNGGDVKIVSITSYTKNGHLRQTRKKNPNVIHATMKVGYEKKD